VISEKHRQRNQPIALNLVIGSAPRSFLAFEPGAVRGCKHRAALGLVNLRGMEVLIKEDEKDAVTFGTSMDPMRSPGLHPGKRQRPFNLQSAFLAIALFDSVELGLARLRQPQAEETRGLVLGHLAGDTRGLRVARQYCCASRFASRRMLMTSDCTCGGMWSCYGRALTLHRPRFTLGVRSHVF
jgi:hypothetical protein